MEGELAITPQDLEGLTAAEVLELLDTGWPFPLSYVQDWFEDLWNDILRWFHQAVGWIWDKLVLMKDTIVSWFTVIKDWIYDKVKPIVDKVWDWITSKVGWLWEKITHAFDVVWDWIKDRVEWLWDRLEPWFDKVWDWVSTQANWLWDKISTTFGNIWIWIQNIAQTVAGKVLEVKDWFSGEFIDPFIDWLTQFPKKFWESLTNWFDTSWEWIKSTAGKIWAALSWWWNMYTTELVRQVKDPKSPLMITWYVLAAAALGAVVAMGSGIAAAIVAAVRWIGGALLSFGGTIGGWFLTIFSRIGGWLLRLGALISPLIAQMLGSLSGWIAKAAIPLFASSMILALGATGHLEPLVDKFVTPAIMGIFDWFERMGPVAPSSGASMSQGITRLATFTISGLAAMTLGGELLSPIKHLGMGHLSAIIYDLINYKTLTAAFMGVLAFVYIKQPLTYYYQRVARPMLPDERMLESLASEYMLASKSDVEATIRGQGSFAELAAKNKEKFVELMAWHGYPDEWSDKMFEKADTPMRYFALGAVAKTGMWDEEFMRDELRNSGYSARGCEFLLSAFRGEATGELRVLMVGAAMKRFREGLDDEVMLRNNLQALGVQPTLLDRYVFAANLDYLYDYQFDLIAYFKDAYHRREIEEPQLRSGLAAAGLLPERLDLYVERERIKRLSAPKPTEPEVSAVKVDTIRRRRRKLLITREQEIEALIKVGVKTDDAVAFADNDDVRLAEKAGEE